MQSERFREPVTVYLKHPDGVGRPTPLTTTEEAYRALMKSDDVPVGDPAWQVALDAVVRALLDPKPEKVEESRRALERLANLRASLDPDNRRTLH